MNRRMCRTVKRILFHWLEISCVRVSFFIFFFLFARFHLEAFHLMNAANEPCESCILVSLEFIGAMNDFQANWFILFKQSALKSKSSHWNFNAINWTHFIQSNRTYTKTKIKIKIRKWSLVMMMMVFLILFIFYLNRLNGLEK